MSAATARLAPVAWGRPLLRGLLSWWRLIRLLAIVLVVVLSPSTYHHANRATTARYIYASTWQVLPWFTALNALLSLVLSRIVVVTAISYGLSQYALEMVVRVLVLELIPLSAALFVALRSGLAQGIAPSATAAPEDGDPGRPDAPAQPTWRFTRKRQLSLTHLRHELVPRVLADTFSVLALATVSSVIALVLAYLMVYGLSPWGLPGYTRSVGHVFDLPVTLGFGLKTLFFSLAVAVVPLAASLEAAERPASGAGALQPGAVRLFLALLLIEAASLAVKYI